MATVITDLQLPSQPHSGTKLYCLVTGGKGHVNNLLRGITQKNTQPRPNQEFKPATSWSQAQSVLLPYHPMNGVLIRSSQSGEFH